MKCFAKFTIIIIFPLIFAALNGNFIVLLFGFWIMNHFYVLTTGSFPLIFYIFHSEFDINYCKKSQEVIQPLHPVQSIPNHQT